LAADVRLGSPQPISQASLDEAARRGVLAARSTRLLSVVFHDDQSQLTNIHAVSAGYPLRGHVLIGSEPFAKGAAAAGIPPRGEVWPDSRLLAATGARIGSSLAIGAATFRVRCSYHCPIRAAHLLSLPQAS
jgi:putative ABC transport system permease protein